MTGILSGALLALVSAAVLAQPSSVELHYDVTLNGARIAAVGERFEIRGNAYHVESESRAVGLLALVQKNPLRLVSSGTVTAGGLRPDRFDGARGANDARRVAAEFDWTGARLTLFHDGRTDEMALPPGTQDRLSVMYQFMFSDLTRRTHIEFAMTNGRKLDRYRYAVVPDVTLDTALGRIGTIHLIKQREAGDTATEIWLAPQYGHLPMKVLVVENDGSRYEQHVTSVSIGR